MTELETTLSQLHARVIEPDIPVADIDPITLAVEKFEQDVKQRLEKAARDKTDAFLKPGGIERAIKITQEMRGYEDALDIVFDLKQTIKGVRENALANESKAQIEKSYKENLKHIPRIVAICAEFDKVMTTTLFRLINEGMKCEEAIQTHNRAAAAVGRKDLDIKDPLALTAEATSRSVGYVWNKKMFVDGYLPNWQAENDMKLISGLKVTS